MAELASFEATVYGRVQGVFFRAFVQEHAERLGLTGYVRNLWGEGVEVRAEGGRARLEELLQHLRVGPRGARVERVEVGWVKYTGDFRAFEIRY